MDAAGAVVDDDVGEGAADVDAHDRFPAAYQHCLGPPSDGRSRRDPSLPADVGDQSASRAGSPSPPPPDVPSRKRSPVCSEMLICLVASSSTVPSRARDPVEAGLTAATAEAAGRRQVHPVAADGEDRVRQHLDVHLGAAARRAIRPTPPESGSQLGAVNQHGVRGLQRLDLRDHRAAAEEVRRRSRPGRPEPARAPIPPNSYSRVTQLSPSGVRPPSV